MIEQFNSFKLKNILSNQRTKNIIFADLFIE